MPSRLLAPIPELPIPRHFALTPDPVLHLCALGLTRKVIKVLDAPFQPRAFGIYVRVVGAGIGLRDLNWRWCCCLSNWRHWDCGHEVLVCSGDYFADYRPGGAIAVAVAGFAIYYAFGDDAGPCEAVL